MKASVVTGRRGRNKGLRSVGKKTTAVYDYASRCISYINDCEVEPQSLSGCHEVDATRQRQPGTAKTNDQLIKELVQTSRLLAKPTDPKALSLDVSGSPRDRHGYESSWDLNRSYGQSTTMDHYRWPQTNQVVPAGSLPDKAEVLLYPDRGQSKFESTTQATYRGLQAKRPDLAKPFDESLKPEGEMEMDTTTRATYKSYDLAGATNPIHSKGGRKTKISSTMSRQGKFYGETQMMRDFPGFGDGQPSPPEPIQPGPDNLGVPYHIRRSFETEQRRQFAGIDPVQHPPPKLIKKLGNSIQLSEEPFETMTNHKMDYLPIKHPPPVGKYLPPLHHSITASDKSRPFEGQTTNKLFFKEWPVSPRRRYGDFYDAYSYVPTINGASINCPLEPQGTAVGDPGSTYRWQLTKPSLVQGLSKAQTTMFLKELRRRKTENDASIKEAESKNHKNDASIKEAESKNH